MSRANVTLRPRLDRDVLALALGVHADPDPAGLLIDPCWNRGSIWKGTDYHPLRCDINAALPNLDIVADWRKLPRFVGYGRALTIVADPLHADDVGRTSIWQRYAADENPFRRTRSVVAQVTDLLLVSSYMLDPDRGTLILKIADQVHSGVRQWQPDQIKRAAALRGWLLCDEWVVPAANVPDPKHITLRHMRSQVHWLVLHTGPECPGPGLKLPGRIRCAHCKRVVAVEREREPGYCRPPRACRQLAYLERRKKAASPPAPERSWSGRT